MTYVTPYLPNDAIVAARGWEREHRQPVFILAFDQNLDPNLHVNSCPNCDGGGKVYIRMAKAGPHKTPGSLAEVSTWFDGNGQFGKGWYIIDKTMAFDCPECKNNKKYDLPSRLISLRDWKQAQEMIRLQAKEMEVLSVPSM